MHEAGLAGSIPAPSSGKYPTRVARAIAECSRGLALYDNKTAALHREQDASIGVMEMRAIVAKIIPGPLPQGCRVTHLISPAVVIANTIHMDVAVANTLLSDAYSHYPPTSLLPICNPS